MVGFKCLYKYSTIEHTLSSEGNYKYNTNNKNSCHFSRCVGQRELWIRRICVKYHFLFNLLVKK